jgi:hypothetical protein
LESLTDPKEKAQREATIRTYQQRGLTLAQELAEEPGMRVIAQELIRHFEQGLGLGQPAEATPVAPSPVVEKDAPKTSGFRWPWERMADRERQPANPVVKGFRQLE